MKGFCALCLALVPDFLAAGLRTPIHFLFSYDEETTCRGPLDIIRRFGGDLPMPVAAIVGEPTSLEVADAHKSVVTFATTVHGHEAHSAKPALGANAVAAAAELVCELSRIGDEMIARGDPSGRFDPPHATVHVGTVAGGTARNILAKTCRLHWEFRGIPGLDPDEIPRRLEGFAQDVALQRLNRYGDYGRIETAMEASVPGLAPDPGSAAERLALRLAGRNATVTVPFATEAGHFQAAGVPTIVCGPGSIDQAHQPDEYITLEDLAAGEGFLRRLAAECAAGAMSVLINIDVPDLTASPLWQAFGLSRGGGSVRMGGTGRLAGAALPLRKEAGSIGARSAAAMSGTGRRASRCGGRRVEDALSRAVQAGAVVEQDVRTDRWGRSRCWPTRSATASA